LTYLPNRIFIIVQVEYATTESVVTVDWENGFVEASAAKNDNITQVSCPLYMYFRFVIHL